MPSVAHRDASTVLPRKRRAAVSLTALLSAFFLLLGTPAAHAVTVGVLDPNATFIYSANTWKNGGNMQYASAAGSTVTNISWSFATKDVPPGGTVEAELCNQYRCAALPANFGSTEKFNGDPADSTFYFRHRLNALKNPMNPVVVYQKSINITYP